MSLAAFYIKASHLVWMSPSVIAHSFYLHTSECSDRKTVEGTLAFPDSSSMVGDSRDTRGVA